MYSHSCAVGPFDWKDLMNSLDVSLSQNPSDSVHLISSTSHLQHSQDQMVLKEEPGLLACRLS